MGIANARHAGIRAAIGDVIVILDSHMEVMDVWLEPLLEVLESKPLSAAIPLVHLIQEKDYDTQHLQTNDPYGFEMTNGFGMIGFYYAGPPADAPTQPYPTSSFAGGAIAAYKSTLLEMYPFGLYSNSWGVENNRFALRAWLCGGGLWVPRCSQILHTNGNDIMLTRYSKESPNMFNILRNENLAEIGNFIGDREEQLRMLSSLLLDKRDFEKVINATEQLSTQFAYGTKCPRDYKWYLDNVHTTLHYMHYDTSDFILVGEAQSLLNHEYCIQSHENKVSLERSCRLEKVLFHDTHLIAFSHNSAIHTR